MQVNMPQIRRNNLAILNADKPIKGDQSIYVVPKNTKNVCTDPSGLNCKQRREASRKEK